MAAHKNNQKDKFSRRNISLVSGVSRTTVNRMLSGNPTKVTITRAKAVAVAMGITLDELYDLMYEEYKEAS